jgi:hypothetical protein
VPEEAPVDLRAEGLAVLATVRAVETTAARRVVCDVVRDTSSVRVDLMAGSVLVDREWVA